MKFKNMVALLLPLFALFIMTSCNSEIQTTEESTTYKSETSIGEETTPSPTPAPIDMPLNRFQQTGEYFSPVLGLCEDYPRGTPVSEIERDFSLMNEYGIRDMRVSIAWGDYETAKNYFPDWSLLDEKVRLAQEYGIELYPYICYSPSWATVDGTWRSPPLDLQDWYDFVYTVVTRYKEEITYWELWNEGDNTDFWTGTWQEQLELVKVGAQAVKDANPSAITIFGGLTNKTPGHVNTIYTSGVAEYIDVINIHYYYETWNPNPTENVYGVTKHVADVIRRYGGKQELWVAEVGYSNYVEEDGRVSPWYSISHPYEKTRQFQAVTFYRTFTRIVATEDVSTILWYEIKDLRLDSVAIGDVNNYFLGALDHDYFPKHLWFALSTAKILFEDPYKPIDDYLEIDDSESERSFVHAFERENKDVVLLAWNRGADTENIEVVVPGEFSYAVSHSVTGEKYFTDFSIKNGKTVFNLELNPECIHIIELFKNELPPLLNITGPKIDAAGNGKFIITATAENIGQKEASQVEGKIIVNNNLEVLSEKYIPVGNIKGKESIELSWEIKVTQNENEESTQAFWIVVKDDNNSLCAVLVDLP